VVVEVAAVLGSSRYFILELSDLRRIPRSSVLDGSVVVLLMFGERQVGKRERRRRERKLS
jgi:hypothetical protein